MIRDLVCRSAPSQRSFKWLHCSSGLLALCQTALDSCDIVTVKISLRSWKGGTYMSLETVKRYHKISDLYSLRDARSMSEGWPPSPAPNISSDAKQMPHFSAGACDLSD